MSACFFLSCLCGESKNRWNLQNGPGLALAHVFVVSMFFQRSLSPCRGSVTLPLVMCGCKRTSQHIHRAASREFWLHLLSSQLPGPDNTNHQNRLESTNPEFSLLATSHRSITLKASGPAAVQTQTYIPHKPMVNTERRPDCTRARLTPEPERRCCLFVTGQPNINAHQQVFEHSGPGFYLGARRSRLKTLRLSMKSPSWGSLVPARRKKRHSKSFLMPKKMSVPINKGP